MGFEKFIKWNKLLGPRNLLPEMACDETELNSISDKMFGCVYIDPPWQYENQSNRANTDKHYNTEGLEWIATLPIDRITAEKSHVWVWTTVQFQEATYKLIRDWGFENKGQFIWAKPQMGMGNYFRISHEILLLGVKGKLRFFNVDGTPNCNIRSWMTYPRGKHSSKPPEIRTMIENCSPPPRLELFSRDPHIPNWTHWGNEILKTEFKLDNC